MGSIVIRIDPSKLQNPDADLRYEIPDSLARRSAGLVTDNGYDYEPAGNAMQIYLRTTDLTKAVPEVVSFLEHESILGNRLADGAQVGINESDAASGQELDASVRLDRIPTDLRDISRCRKLPVGRVD